jgi:hypothetical protein
MHCVADDIYEEHPGLKLNFELAELVLRLGRRFIVVFEIGEAFAEDNVLKETDETNNIGERFGFVIVILLHELLEEWDTIIERVMVFKVDIIELKEQRKEELFFFFIFLKPFALEEMLKDV